METNQVAVKYTKQDLVTDGKDSVDFRAGEWSVQEEADLHILLAVAKFLTQHGRHEHKVVVVYPHHIVVLDFLCDSLREQAIGLGVPIPSRLVKGDLSGMVVEKRPHDGICRLISILG